MGPGGLRGELHDGGAAGCQGGPGARTVRITGEFHGEVVPATPTASRSVRRWVPSGTSAARPCTRVSALAEAQRSEVTEAATSHVVWGTSSPLPRVMATAISSTPSSSRSAI